ncbi:hypothetical protein [Synechococcus sp. PCC 7336]|uniref:hypothetical protein n=1 Tax=Synechococcus sp. PCC 7336 TaxID=195250 RepID=UPI00034D6936|nr:hypothetical protein [Synechococcus sp. PCC 7336]
MQSQTTLSREQLNEAEIRAELDRFDDRIADLKDKFALAGGEAKAEYERLLQSLYERRNSVQNKLQELQTSTESARREISSGLERAWQDLQTAFERAYASFS